jgi:hypothetical protein
MGQSTRSLVIQGGASAHIYDELWRARERITITSCATSRAQCIWSRLCAALQAGRRGAGDSGQGHNAVPESPMRNLDSTHIVGDYGR